MCAKPGLLVISEKNVQRLNEFLELAKHMSRLYVRLNTDAIQINGIVANIYLRSAKLCPETDVRVLVKSELPENYSKTFQVIGGHKPDFPIQHVPRKYKKVVLGGTFDRLHNGHKVLLNKAAELATDEIVVGVSDAEMIYKKSLFEMIEPLEHRMKKVVDFVEDVSGSAKCSAEPIIDPFGPSIQIPDLEAIIVSRETVKGGDAVNKKRLEKGMNPLEVIIVELIEGFDEVLKETKISSSSRRREDLGRLLRPVLPNSYKKKSYFINLTGGVASGKREIGRYLNEKYGFEIVNWDDMDAEGKARVFEKAGEKVTVLKSSLPIESSQISEIWTVFVPPAEAARRIVESSNDATPPQVSSEISNKERIDNSHVVLCSLWSQEETRAQVDRAVAELLKRI